MARINNISTGRPQGLQGHINDNGEAVIYLYTRVYSWWHDDFPLLLRQLEKSDVKTLHLRINSAGGDVFAGLAVYNLLRSHNIKVITHVDGEAASIASIIALSGDKVCMSRSGFLMIHRAWMEARGDYEELRKAAETLEKITSQLIDIYVRKTGKTTEEVKAMVDSETWLTSGEAIEGGFIDEIEEPIASAPANLTTKNPDDLYKHFAAQLTTNNSQKSDMDKTQLIKQLGLNADASDADIKNAIEMLQTVKDRNEQREANEKEAKVKALIDKAITAKKILAGEAEKWKGYARGNFEMTQDMLAKIPAYKPLSQTSTPSRKAATGGEKKVIQDYNIKELNDLRENDFQAYSDLVEKTYGKKPSTFVPK